MTVPPPNPTLRRRIELGIRIVAPLLDLVIVVADRVSRVLEADDPDYVPARMSYEGESAPRSVRIPFGTRSRG